MGPWSRPTCGQGTSPPTRSTQQLGITLGGVRLLVHRGQLQRSGGTARQPWYAVEDVAALSAKRAARKAA
jgi:hypothetical protein